MPRWRRIVGSVRTRMVMLVIIVLLPFTVVLFVQAANARDRGRLDAELDSRRLATLSADRLAFLIEQSRALMRGFSAQGGFRAGAGCEATLQDLQAQLPALTNVVSISPDGLVTCSAEPVGPGAVDLSDRDYVREALDEAGFAVGLEPDGDLTNTTELIAVRPAGADPSAGLLAVVIDPSEGADTFFNDLNLPDGSSLEVVDFEGRIIASAPNAAIGATVPVLEIVEGMAAVLTAGSQQGEGLDGTTRIYSYTAVVGTDEHLYAIIGIPTSAALAVANKDLRTNLTWLAMVALAALALAIVLSELALTRRLGAVMGSVRRIGSGDLTARTGLRRVGEIGELGGAVDDMAAELRARGESLRAAGVERERLLAELLDAQAEERRRIAADIHDDSIQGMIATGLQAQLLRRELDQPGQIERVRQLEIGVNEAVGRLRQLMFELEPAVLDEGLEVSLEHYLASVLAKDGAEVEVAVNAPDAKEPAGAIRQVLYRNLREAVLNAIRHGNASRIEVTVEPADGGLLVTAADNGTGFDPVDALKAGHYGLRTMRERCDRLDGWLRLDTSVGQGTTISFWLP